jgi:hypothetical protein
MQTLCNGFGMMWVFSRKKLMICEQEPCVTFNDPLMHTSMMPIVDVTVMIHIEAVPCSCCKDALTFEEARHVKQTSSVRLTQD